MEPAMTFTTFGTHRHSRWNHVKHQFAEWRRRVRSRGELDCLSDQSLRDIGISRWDARREVMKPFWMA